MPGCSVRAGARRVVTHRRGLTPYPPPRVIAHYLPRGTATGTVILLRDAGWKEDDLPRLLRSLDQDMLPDVDLDRGTLTYTVVMGDVLGNFEATLEDTPPAPKPG